MVVSFGDVGSFGGDWHRSWSGHSDSNWWDGASVRASDWRSSWRTGNGGVDGHTLRGQGNTGEQRARGAGVAGG